MFLLIIRISMCYSILQLLLLFSLISLLHILLCSIMLTCVILRFHPFFLSFFPSFFFLSLFPAGLSFFRTPLASSYYCYVLSSLVRSNLQLSSSAVTNMMMTMQCVLLFSSPPSSHPGDCVKIQAFDRQVQQSVTFRTNDFISALG